MEWLLMKRRVLVFLGLVLLIPFIGAAAPYGAEGKQVKFKQPNGEVLALRVFGDEFYAVTETLDGYTVVFDPATRAYYYATLSPDGSAFLSTGQLAGSGGVQAARGQLKSKSPNVPKHLRVKAEKKKEIARERLKRWDDAMGISKRWKEAKDARRAASAAADGDAVSSSASDISMAPPAYTTTGTKVGLTLLIDFENDKATIARTNIQAFCNGANYTGYGNNGSVMQYFKDNSKNMLTYSNVVTIYVRIPNSVHPKSWYNDTSKDNGEQSRLLIRDAIKILTNRSDYASTILPTFKNLTLDSSGRVVAFNVFFAGSASGVWSQGLWPNSWTLGSSLPLSSGINLYKYQLTDIGDALELGTFCHENGHMLCDYPDIYDYDYDSSGGAGKWCLMNSYGSGQNPVQICAYLKRASGWATTVELTSNSVLTASVSSSGSSFNRFYRYAKPGTPTEYYLIENRQKTGRDASIPGSGIAIWHIDELGDRDNQSTAYNTSHANYEVSLVQADNQFHLQKDVNSGDSKDLYYSGNTASGYANQFSDSTAPSAKWWSGSSSKINFRNFSANGTTMTFTVGASSAASCHIDTPTGNVTKNLGETLAVSVTASDPDGVERVKIYLNGVEKMSDASSPYSFNLPLTNAGTFTLTAKVKDLLGNYTASDNSRTITVQAVTQTTTVPWVTNLTLFAAGTSITNAGLAVGTVSQENHATVAAGKIFSQTPGGGTTVNRGTSVNLAVSLGPQTGNTVTFTSVAAHDGYVDESSETSNVGGTMNATSTSGTAIRVGDTGARKQRKGFVSFNTASLPDTAVVTKAILKLKRGGIVGTPTSLGALTADIKGVNAGFGTSVALEAGDFQASASKSNVGTFNYPTANNVWATASLDTNGTARVNRTGHTQFRIHFATDDDNDSADDYLGFYSGENATAANRPVLEVTYQ